MVLHTISLLAEFVLLLVNVVHTVNNQKARDLQDVDTKLWEDLLFLALSFVLTLITFVINLMGARPRLPAGSAVT